MCKKCQKMSKKYQTNFTLIIKPPSSKCNKLREKIMRTFPHVFKEELEPHDRMKVEPVKIKFRKEFIQP